MKTHILSIFDKHHLVRGLTLRETLYKHAPDTEVSFLCLDNEAYELLKRINLRATNLFTPEMLNDPELLESRKTRTNPEFASTAKPAFLLHVLKSKKISSSDLLGFIDPDFLFYTSAQPIFEKIYSSGSIVITPHRFPKPREQEKYAKGVYNAGMVFFKKDSAAFECLEEWRKQCIDWCYLRYEDGKIGDQGYLSDWPKKYQNVFELVDKGVNLSTWNISQYKITKDSTDNGFYIDEDPLICYHFHGLKIYTDANNRVHPYPVTIYHREIYAKYVQVLQQSYDKVLKLSPVWPYGFAQRPSLFRLLKQHVMQFYSNTKRLK